MFYITDRKNIDARVQAPFVSSAIRALRSSVFKGSAEIQQALRVAHAVEQRYDLSRNDLFIPVVDTLCAILDPLAHTLLTGTLRRVGSEVFPELLSVLGTSPSQAKEALGLKGASDLGRMICGHYARCVIGPDAGALTFASKPRGFSVTDTSIMPCHLQIGVFIGAGTLTGLFREGE